MIKAHTHCGIVHRTHHQTCVPSRAVIRNPFDGIAPGFNDTITLECRLYGHGFNGLFRGVSTARQIKANVRQ